jgi:hypothetical protein
LVGPALTSPKLFLKLARERGIFLTFVPSKASQGSGKLADGEVGEGQQSRAGGFQAGRSHPQTAPRTAFFFFIPSPVKFFKSSKQQQGQWSSLHRVTSSVSGKDQSCSSEGEGKRKKMGGEGKKLPGPISAG